MFKPYSYIHSPVIKDSPYEKLTREVDKYSSDYRKEASK